jgi:hypothetical protein
LPKSVQAQKWKYSRRATLFRYPPKADSLAVGAIAPEGRKETVKTIAQGMPGDPVDLW